MTPLKLLICIPATLYIAYILTAQNGPFSLFARLRGVKPLTELLSCIYCTSPYVALAVYLLAQENSVGYSLVQIFAIAGSALALKQYTGFGGINGL